MSFWKRVSLLILAETAFHSPGQIVEGREDEDGHLYAVAMDAETFELLNEGEARVELVYPESQTTEKPNHV